MELKEVSDLISMIDVDDGKLEVHTHWGGFDEDMKEALNIARKSLEAWELVKEEIKNAKPVYPDRERIWSTDTILALIDKHLKEVENE